MTHELVIRGGHLVDGLGGGPVPGDLAIDAGTITSVGRVDAKGKRELDAEGLMGHARIHRHACRAP